MKLGIVLNSNDAEEVWNAFRFGNVALKKNHAVRIFLLGKGVEAEDIKSERFPVKEQMQAFIDNKGDLLACGTCLNARAITKDTLIDGVEVGTMLKLAGWIKESDSALSF